MYVRKSRLVVIARIVHLLGSDSMPKLPNEPSSEITDFDVYVRRRDFMRRAGALVGVSAAWAAGLVALSSRGRGDPPTPPPLPENAAAWRVTRREAYGLTDPPNE